MNFLLNYAKDPTAIKTEITDGKTCVYDDECLSLREENTMHPRKAPGQNGQG